MGIMCENEQKFLFAEFSQVPEPTLFPLYSADENRIHNHIHGTTHGTGQDLSQAIRRVLIYANPSKPRTSACLEELMGILGKMKIEPLVYKEFTPSRAHLAEYLAQTLHLPTQPGEPEPFSNLGGQNIFDLVITVGGDGTVLKYLSCTPFRKIPILPVNTGTLGYITSISFHNMADSIRSIFSGSFVYSPRLMLQAWLLDSYQNPKHSHSHFALNEVAISTYRAGLVADMELQVGNSSIPLQGDGIIAATPTGSTAYSLAAGGPIVNAEMEAIIITPVSPFSLATRPVVTPSNVHLFVRNAASPPRISPGAAQKPDAMEALSVAIDGWPLGELYPGESVYITGSQERIHFLAMSHSNSYFENIRTKLGWHNVSHQHHL